MLIVGYFEVRIYDTIALGFGVYKLNLLSILDSTNNIREISWSWFMPDIKLAKGEELEGFNYLGFGGLLLIFLSSFLFFVSNKARVFIKNNFDLKIILIITLITLYLFQTIFLLDLTILFKFHLIKYFMDFLVL